MRANGAQEATRRARRLASLAGTLLLLGSIAGCGDSSTRRDPSTRGHLSASAVRLEAYVGALCKAIGPFERDAHTFAREVAGQGIEPKSLAARQGRDRLLKTMIVDTNQVVTTLEAQGAPMISRGHALAARTIAAFRHMERAYSAWKASFDGGISLFGGGQAARDVWLTVLRAPEIVGRQFELLPMTPERIRAMAASTVCRDEFGPVRAAS